MPTPVQPSKNAQLPTELLPFNIAAALKRANNDSELVHKMILMFYDNFRDTTKALQQFIVNSNYEEAQRLVHKLRGAAMILEIGELSGIAAATEVAIQSHHTGKVNLYVKTLESVLEPALEAAASLLPSTTD